MWKIEALLRHAPRFLLTGAAASLSLVAGVSAAQTQSAPPVAVTPSAPTVPSSTVPPTPASVLVDPLSGQAFELHRRIASSETMDVSSTGSPAFHNFGCNTRCMLGWCWMPIARAYAFAFYVDDDGIRWGYDESRKGGTPSIQRLLDRKQTAASDFEVAIVLKMARDISGEHLAHGFRNSILARLPHAEKGNTSAALASGQVAAGIRPTTAVGPATPVGSAPASEPIMAQITRFTSAFNGLTFKKGEEIVVVWGRDGQARTYLNGTLADGGARNATLTHVPIIRALFDVYVGEKNPVSAVAKQTISNNWRSVVQSDGLFVGDVATAPSNEKITPTTAAEPPPDVFDRMKAALLRLQAKFQDDDSSTGMQRVIDTSPSRAPKVQLVEAAVSDVVLKEHTTRNPSHAARQPAAAST